MPLIEIEVKFYIQKYEEIINKIINYAGKPVETGFEKNILFDTKNQILRESMKILRLRSYRGKNIMTFKKPTKKTSDDFKILEETETEFSSFKNMKSILEGIGFLNQQVYEKERMVFKKEGLIICADRLPFGDFIELEGEEEYIRKGAKDLNLNWDERILPSYRTIFEQIKNDHNLDFTDISFSNFKTYNKSIFQGSIKRL